MNFLKYSRKIAQGMLRKVNFRSTLRVSTPSAFRTFYRVSQVSGLALLFGGVALAQSETPQEKEKNPSDDAYKNYIVPNRSGKPTESDQSGLVYRVIGDTAEEVLFNPTKCVLLKVYSPSCDSCKKLDIIWHVVADEFAKVTDKVVFANMDGYENYIRGLIDIENEGRFPHIIAFPAGVEKHETFKKSQAMSQQFAEYHNHRLPSELKQQLIFDADGVDTPSDTPISFTREDIPVVGAPWNLKWKQGQSMLDAMVEFVGDHINGTDPNSTLSAQDIETIKFQVLSRVPEMQDQVIANSKGAFFQPWDRAVQSDPCGMHIKRAMENFYAASAGLPTAPLGALAMADYRQCLYTNEKAVRKFYKEIEEHVDFLSEIMEKKQEWEVQDQSLRAQVVEKYPDLALVHGLTASPSSSSTQSSPSS